jgi:cyclase
MEVEMRKNPWFSVSLIALLFMICVASGHEVLAQEGLKKIAEDVYSYVDVKKSGPQNSYGANAAIVIGQDGIVVIDTFISSKEAKRFISDIRAISDKPIKYVVNTHYHLDHTFGNCEFQKLGAIIISHTSDKDNALIHGNTVLKNIQGYGLTERDMEGTSIVFPDLTFSDKMEIDLGGQRIQLIYPKRSHTDGSILVYLPDKKVLFTGDILFTDYHPFMADGDIKSWARVLDYIMAMDVDTIIPGHGPISSKKDIQEMKKYIIAFDKKARQLSAKSKDADYIAAQLKSAMPPRAEADWLIKANVQMRYLKK